MVTQPPGYAITGPASVCQGDTATLTVTGGVNYLWDAGSILPDTTVAPLSTTTYSVTVTDSVGCTGATQFTLVVDTIPTVSVAPDTAICEGESVTLVGQGSGNFLWSTGQQTSTILVAPSDTTVFTLTITDSKGCSNADSLTVDVWPSPNAQLAGVNPVSCSNDSIVQLVGTPAGGTYAGTGVTDPVSGTWDPSVIPTGIPVTLSYTVTDTLGCIDEATITTTVLNVSSVQFVGLGGEYCLDTIPRLLTGTPPGGMFFGPGISNNVFVPFFAGAGSHVIGYSRTDTNGCVATAIDSTIVHPLPNVVLGQLDSAYCISDTLVALTGSPAGGAFSGIAVTDSIFNPEQAGLNGPHAVVYSYIDTNGCENFDFQEVLVLGLPQLEFVGLQTSYCNNDGAIILQGLPMGGLFNGTGVIGGELVPEAVAPGTYVLEYVYTDSVSGCIDSVRNLRNH